MIQWVESGGMGLRQPLMLVVKRSLPCDATNQRFRYCAPPVLRSCSDSACGMHSIGIPMLLTRSGRREHELSPGSLAWPSAALGGPRVPGGYGYSYPVGHKTAK